MAGRAVARPAVPVEKQLGRDAEHLLVAHIEAGCITARLRAPQGRKQGAGRLRPAALHTGHRLCRVVDLVILATGNGLVDGGQGRIKLRTPGQGVPVQCGRILGRRLGTGPGQRRVMDGKPDQRASGGVGLQSGVEGRRGLVAQRANAPGTALGGGLHGIEHRAHLGRLPRHQHGARRAKGMAQARRTGVVRVDKINQCGWNQVSLHGLQNMRKRLSKTE